MNPSRCRLVGAAMLGLAALALSPPPFRESAIAHCRDRKPTGWDIQVAPASEPGERLILSGYVLSRQRRTRLGGVSVYVYHADVHGRYSESNRESDPRLCGVLRTDATGRYQVRTTMPGGYGGYAPHVHFEVWGHGVSRQARFVNLSRAKAQPAPDPLKKPLVGDSWPPSRETGESNESLVFRGKDGVLRCRYDLVVDAR